MNVYEPGQTLAIGPGNVTWLAYGTDGVVVAACYLDGSLVQRNGDGYFRLGAKGEHVPLTERQRAAIAAVSPPVDVDVLADHLDLLAGETEPELEDDAWPRLGAAALYGLAGEVVATIDPHTEADPAAVLSQLLTAFGSSVGSCPHVRADGADHPARLYVVVVGSSSKARKGTAWRQVRNVMREADPDWSSSRVLSGLSSGEGVIAAVADATSDKDGRSVGGVTDKRLFVIEEEFSRALGVKSREGNTLSAIVRQAWDTGDLRSMTRTPQVATNAHVSIVGHITLDELRATLTELDRANGFGNRFIFVVARRSKLLPSGGNLDDADVARLGKSVKDALLFARPVGRLYRDAAADERWHSLYAELAEEDENEGLTGALCARAEAQVTRLALTYALLDRSKVINLDHLNAAEAFWRYSEASVRHIFGDSTGDPIAEQLLAAVERAGADGLTGRDQHALFGRNVSARRIAVARQELVRRGRIVIETTTGPGRPGTVIRTVRTTNNHEQTP